MRRRPGAGSLALAALWGLLGACGGAPDEGPPQVAWGLDECSRCRMILSDPRYAAVARDSSGREARFDDLGDAAAYVAEHDPATWRVWVLGPDDWLPAEQAWYVVDPGVVTPMASGVVAYRGEDAARAAVGEATTIRRWAELLEQQRSARSP